LKTLSLTLVGVSAALLAVAGAFGCDDEGGGPFGFTDTDADSDTDSDGDTDSDTDGDTDGCGLEPLHEAGGVNVTIDVGPEGDGERNFFLSLPASYDPLTPHALIFGFPGTDWVGEQIQPYLQLESGAVTPQDDEIFVYLDPLWHDFDSWGYLGGWLLGPHAYPADGDQDLVFTTAVVEYMDQNYCIDSERVFATGHSWGGDMAMVVGCFLGDVFRATAPVAANRPYWFEDGPDSMIDCVGEAAVWVMFGLGDTHFTWQDYPGQFGDECRDFWLEEHGCDGVDSFTDLGLGGAGECVEYTGCSSITRYCLYDEAHGHQIPDDYFAPATME
jgi:polyhydroxybutyrate depolymerase